MKKHNFLMQAAIASALVGASVSAMAGTLTPTAINFATQIFGATATSAVEIVPGVLTYTYGTPGGIVLNPNGVINMYFRLGNGATFTAAPATGDFSGTAVTGLGLTRTAVALSTDKTTAVLTLTNGTTANVTIGVGATLTWTAATGRGVSSVNTVLNTANNTVGVTASASVLPANANSATLPADVDNGVATSVAIATAKSAINGAVVASSAFASPNAETQKIDVGSTPVSQSLMTTGVNSTVKTIVNFGSVTFTNVAGVKQVDGATDYTIAAKTAATGLGATVTGSFTAAGTGTGSVKLTTDAACTTAIVAGGTATLPSPYTTATFTGGTAPTTAVPNYVCMTVNGTTVIPATTPTITATLTPSTGTDAPVSVSGTLYALTSNGSTVDVRTYVPAANTAYTSFIRVINTGSSSAAITASVIDPTTGAAGAAFTIIPTLASGASSTLTSAQIEGMVGAPSPALGAAVRPRLRISGQTSGLNVQSFLLTNANGDFSEVSNAQVAP